VSKRIAIGECELAEGLSGRMEKADYLSLPAEGEYFDFGKFDLAKATHELETEGKKNTLQVPTSFPSGIFASVLQSADFGKKGLSGYYNWHASLNTSKTDRYLAWHASNEQNGYFVKAAAGAKGELSLSAQASGHSCLHHVIVAEKGSKLDLTIESSSHPDAKPNPQHPEIPGSPSLHTEVFEVFVEDDATVNLATVQDYAKSDFVFTHLFFRLGRFSRLCHAAGAFGGAASRLRIQNHLLGGHCKVDSFQLFFTEGEQFSDVCSSTYHHVPDTTGEMLAKAALTGKSRCAYKGYIKVDTGAKNSITHQGGTALLLSRESAANVMPALDVENNEVEAGHGAAVGELSGDEMTYLRSRGLSEEESRSLIVEGYFDELLAKFPYLGGRAKLKQRLTAKMGTIKKAGKQVE